MFPKMQIASTVPMSQGVTCGSCNSKVNTTVDRKLNTTGWIVILVLYLCCWPLSWLPFLYSYSYKNVHVCPNCKAILSYEL